jgi:uncharacterized membrane protein YbhN (UPF0104 family)
MPKIFRIIISILLFFFILSQIERIQINKAFTIFSFYDFAIIISLIIFSIILIYKRYSYIVKYGYNLELPFKTKFTIFSSNIGLSQLPLPGAQEVGKYYQLSKYCKNNELNFYLVLLERFTSLMSSIFILIVLFLINLKFYFLNSDFINNYYNLIIALIILAIISVYFFIKTFINKLPYFSYIFNFLQFNIKYPKKFMFISFLFSLFIQIISNFVGYYSLAILIEFPNPVAALLILQLINILMTLPISFGGVGYREALYLSLFSQLSNFNKHYVFSSSLVISLTSAIIILFLSISGLLFSRSKT